MLGEFLMWEIWFQNIQIISCWWQNLAFQVLLKFIISNILFRFYLFIDSYTSSGLSEQLLGIFLNKHFSVRCSDWETDELSTQQITYAAQDAIASIAVCLKLLAETDLWNKHHGRQQFGSRFSSFLVPSWVYYDFNRLCSMWAYNYVVTDLKYRATSASKKINAVGKTNLQGTVYSKDNFPLPSSSSKQIR